MYNGQTSIYRTCALTNKKLRKVTYRVSGFQGKDRDYKMGRIKTKLIKRVGKELVLRHRAEFKPTFDENKIILEKYAEIRSKKLRNLIAGYITHLKQLKE